MLNETRTAATPRTRPHDQDKDRTKVGTFEDIPKRDKVGWEELCYVTRLNLAHLSAVDKKDLVVR